MKRSSPATAILIDGDKERQREQRRAAMDDKVGVGSQVFDLFFGSGTIVRVNHKTYTIRFAAGPTYARDKATVDPA